MKAPSDLPPLYTDRVKVKQVFLNLLSTAAHVIVTAGVRGRMLGHRPAVRG